MEQKILAVVGDVDIRETIRIVVTHRHALPVATVGHPRLLGCVAEANLAVRTGAEISIQLVGSFASRALPRLQLAPIGKEKVEPAIKVGIQPGHTTSHHFHDHPAAFNNIPVIHKIDACFLGDVFKDRLHARGSGLLSRSGWRVCL